MSECPVKGEHPFLLSLSGSRKATGVISCLPRDGLCAYKHQFILSFDNPAFDMKGSGGHVNDRYASLEVLLAGCTKIEELT